MTSLLCDDCQIRKDRNTSAVFEANYTCNNSRGIIQTESKGRIDKQLENYAAYI